MSNPQVPDPGKPYTGGKGSGLSAPTVIGLVILAALRHLHLPEHREHRGQLPVLRASSAPLWLILAIVAILGGAARRRRGPRLPQDAGQGAEAEVVT